MGVLGQGRCLTRGGGPTEACWGDSVVPTPGFCGSETSRESQAALRPGRGSGCWAGLCPCIREAGSRGGRRRKLSSVQTRPHHLLVLRAPGDGRVRLGSWTWERTISTPLAVQPPERQSGGGGEKKAVGRGGGVSSQHLTLWALPAPASLRLPP